MIRHTYRPSRRMRTIIEKASKALQAPEKALTTHQKAAINKIVEEIIQEIAHA